jgi:LemA protein
LATSDQKACPAGFFVLYSKEMLESSLITPVLLLCGLACFAWLAVCYTKLSRLRKDIDESFAKIDVHIKERHDLAPLLIEIVKQHGQNAHATSTLIDNVVRARHTMATSAERVRAFSNDTSSINSLVNADVAFNLALENLTSLQNTHASLRNDELFTNLVKKLNTIESNISFTHQLYNDVVNNYNNACATFPSLLLAGALGFRTAGTMASTRQRNTTNANLSQA